MLLYTNLNIKTSAGRGYYQYQCSEIYRHEKARWASIGEIAGLAPSIGVAKESGLGPAFNTLGDPRNPSRPPTRITVKFPYTLLDRLLDRSMQKHLRVTVDLQ